MRFAGSSNPTGGTITSVQTVVDPVTTAGGTVDTVHTVTNPVVAGSGTVDNVTNPVTAGGGTVGTVTNPVTPDPASTIAVVSTTVPFPFRDGAFWPCVSGEPYGPTFASGGSYSSLAGLPVAQTTATGTNNTVAWPSVPRISFSGKTSITFAGKVAFTSVGSGGRSAIGFNSIVGGLTRRAQFEFVQSGASVRIDVTYCDGTTVTSVASVVAPVAPNVMHTFSIAMATNGVITFQWDGVTVVTTAAAIWASTVTDTTPKPETYTAGATGPSFGVGIPQVTWS